MNKSIIMKKSIDVVDLFISEARIDKKHLYDERHVLTDKIAVPWVQCTCNKVTSTWYIVYLINIVWLDREHKYAYEQEQEQKYE